MQDIFAMRDHGARDEAYKMHILEPLLQNRHQYVCMQAALRDLHALVAAIPVPWKQAARAALAAQPPLGHVVVTAALIAAARSRVCSDLGWHLPDGEVVRPDSLTVAVATKLQSLDSHVAIAARHMQFDLHVGMLDVQQPGVGGHPLPSVPTVLARWWKLRVPNCYKEAAWRLTLNAFPTADRMPAPAGGQPKCCAACGAVNPGIRHHFWLCPMADAVRQEVESQLRAKNMLGVGARLLCSHVWKGVKPHHGLHGMVWDMVCLAAVHAMNVGRQAAWSLSHRLETPDLVADVVQKIAKAAFWSVLADFAVSAVVPRAARTARLTNQPFLVWPVVVVRGSGLRVVRY
jgi:hypothetical protein